MSTLLLLERVSQANRSSAIMLQASPHRCGNALEFDVCRHAGNVPRFQVRECDASAPTFYSCPCAIIPE